MSKTVVLLPKERFCLLKLRFLKVMSEDKIPNCNKLYKYGLIRPNYLPQDETGQFIGNGTVSLTDEYYRYIQENKWFTLRYVITQIVVPIVIGVASAYITLFLEQH